MQTLTRHDVESAFGEIGEILLRRKKLVEIAVYGGAAILMQYEVDFHTHDVDAVIETGDHGALMQAAREVAERHGWLRSWFSEAVANYVGSGGTTLHGSYPSEARTGLRVYVAKPDYLLAMKLWAMRAGSRDEADATLLAHACNITSYDALVALMASYFPKQPLDPRRMVIVGQFAQTLHAPE